MRELRAECYIAQGDLFKAAGDIRPTTKLRNDNTAGYFKLSNLHYQMGEADESLRYVLYYCTYFNNNLLSASVFRFGQVGLL